MGFLELLEVASMPIVQVLLISVLGAFLATDYCSLLSADTRRSVNKLVFVVFTPCIMFANLAQTVTLQDIISWWFMPINVGITFLVGGILGWLVVKLLNPKPQLHGLIIATCASGNMGNLMIILVPAICDEEGSPFGNRSVCRSIGLSYASFSMALGGFYIWTYSYQLVRSSATQFKALGLVKSANKDMDSDDPRSLLLKPQQNQDLEIQVKEKVSTSTYIKDLLHQILEELFAPPTVGAILGFIFGATNWLRNLIIGENAPLRVIQDSVKLLGDGTIPCITLILGGNLIQGLRSSAVKTSVIVGVICVRYIILPVVGVGVVQLAWSLGYLPPDPLFRYVLMLQFTLPPAMNISTMAQLFDVAQDECSVIFLWTYLVASLALTMWAMFGSGVGSKRQRMMQSNPPYGGFPVVRLRGLPFNCADVDIFKFFAGLDIVDVLLVSKNGKSSGEAFVVFAGPMQVEIALRRDRQNMGRRYVEVFRCYKQDYYNAVAAEEEGVYENNEVHVRAKSYSESKEKLEYTEVLKMRGLPYSANKPQIVEFFSGYKGIEGRVHVVCRPDGKATGEAFVEFETAEEARRAMAKDKMSIGPRYVELFPTTREEARRAESRSRQ
uniref:RRM domain-containing protein n=1 Tax=Brassica campestris TaxID=3711 RepID=M4F7Y2_BRACM